MDLMGNYLTTGEAARTMGVSDTYIRRLVQGGRLAGERSPLGLLIPRAAVADLMEERRIHPPKPGRPRLRAFDGGAA